MMQVFSSSTAVPAGASGGFADPLAHDGGAGLAVNVKGDLPDNNQTPEQTPDLPYADRKHWTAAAKTSFLNALARCGNVGHSASYVSMSRESAYRLRRRDADFAAAWDGALVIAVQIAEDALQDKALHGWEEEVYFHGEEVGRRTRFDGRLLLALLGRLDKRADGVLAQRGAARFDDMIAAIGAGRPLGDMLAEPDAGESARLAAQARAELQAQHARAEAVRDMVEREEAAAAQRAKHAEALTELASLMSGDPDCAFYRIDEGEDLGASYAVLYREEVADLEGSARDGAPLTVEAVAADDEALVQVVMARGLDAVMLDGVRMVRWFGAYDEAEEDDAEEAQKGGEVSGYDSVTCCDPMDEIEGVAASEGSGASEWAARFREGASRSAGETPRCGSQDHGEMVAPGLAAFTSPPSTMSVVPTT